MPTFRAIFAALSLTLAAAPASASPDMTYPAAGESYGGKVRAGPGMHFNQVGSLREGDRVTITNGTGVMMNGYEWFEVRYHGGRVGYQWGGLMCSHDYVPNLYSQCAGRQTNQQTGGGNPVSHHTVPAVVEYNGGQFVREPRTASWVEYTNNGTFRFEEYGMQNGVVVLLDDQRRVNVHLNLNTREVLFAQGPEPMRPLYSITGIQY